MFYPILQTIVFRGSWGRGMRSKVQEQKKVVDEKEKTGEEKYEVGK